MAVKSFILHDESVNTRGFRLLTSGANLEEFKKNPVMLLNHNDYSMPIGRWENIRKEGGKIIADPVFDDQDVTGREVKGKVERDFIRMASIGAWPPEEVDDNPVMKLEGQRGPTVTRWTVREASIVTIGGNHNAMAFYDRTTGDRIDMDDEEINYLRNISQDYVSLDATFGDSDDTSIISMMEDSRVDAPDRKLLDDSLKEALNAVLNTLTASEREILKMRFGLDGEKPLSLQQIGEKFRLSKERIRQIEKKAIRRLRHPSRSQRLKSFIQE